MISTPTCRQQQNPPLGTADPLGRHLSSQSVYSACSHLFHTIAGHGCAPRLAGGLYRRLTGLQTEGARLLHLVCPINLPHFCWD